MIVFDTCSAIYTLIFCFTDERLDLKPERRIVLQEGSKMYHMFKSTPIQTIYTLETQ